MKLLLKYLLKGQFHIYFTFLDQKRLSVVVKASRTSRVCGANKSGETLDESAYIYIYNVDHMGVWLHVCRNLVSTLRLAVCCGIKSATMRLHSGEATKPQPKVVVNINTFIDRRLSFN